MTRGKWFNKVRVVCVWWSVLGDCLGRVMFRLQVRSHLREPQMCVRVLWFSRCWDISVRTHQRLPCRPSLKALFWNANCLTCQTYLPTFSKQVRNSVLMTLIYKPCFNLIIASKYIAVADLEDESIWQWGSRPTFLKWNYPEDQQRPYI